MSEALLQEALKVAQSQNGVSEQPKGSNRGPQVDQYLLAVGLDPKGRFPWCAAFVYWCYGRAAEILARSNPLVKTAGVLDHWNRAPKQGAKNIPKDVAFADTSLIKPGMIFVMRFGHGAGHTGLVVSVDAGAKLVHTIEGNTNDDGSREGYEVACRTRAISTLLGFIDYSEA